MNRISGTNGSGNIPYGRWNSISFMAEKRRTITKLQTTPTLIRRLGVTGLSLAMRNMIPNARVLFRQCYDILLIQEGKCPTAFQIRKKAGIFRGGSFEIGIQGAMTTFVDLPLNVPVVIGTGSGDSIKMLDHFERDFPVYAFAVTYNGGDSFTIESLSAGITNLYLRLQEPEILSVEDERGVLQRNVDALRIMMMHDNWKIPENLIYIKNIGNAWQASIRLSILGEILGDKNDKLSNCEYFETQIAISDSNNVIPLVEGLMDFLLPHHIRKLLTRSVDSFNHFNAFGSDNSLN